jgi:hypothetical protein
MSSDCSTEHAGQASGRNQVTARGRSGLATGSNAACLHHSSTRPLVHSLSTSCPHILIIKSANSRRVLSIFPSLQWYYIEVAFVPRSKQDKSPLQTSTSYLCLGKLSVMTEYHGKSKHSIMKSEILNVKGGGATAL